MDSVAARVVDTSVVFAHSLLMCHQVHAVPAVTRARIMTQFHFMHVRWQAAHVPRITMQEPADVVTIGRAIEPTSDVIVFLLEMVRVLPELVERQFHHLRNLVPHHWRHRPERELHQFVDGQHPPTPPDGQTERVWEELRAGNLVEPKATPMEAAAVLRRPLLLIKFQGSQSFGDQTVPMQCPQAPAQRVLLLGCHLQAALEAAEQTLLKDTRRTVTVKIWSTKPVGLARQKLRQGQLLQVPHVKEGRLQPRQAPVRAQARLPLVEQKACLRLKGHQ